MKRKHNDTERVACPTCGTSLVKRYVQTHIDVVHNKDQLPRLTCDECDTVCIGQMALRQHKSFAHVEKSHICDKCPAAFKRKDRLEFHIQHVHEKETLPDLPCGSCDAIFKAEYIRQSHIKQVHLREYLDDLPCPHCNKTFKVMGTLNVHIKSVHGERNISCSQCDKKWATTSQLNEHIRFVHNSESLPDIKCPQCDHTTKEPGNMKNHIDRHNKESLPDIPCDQCDLIFKFTQDLKSHVDRFHNKHMLPDHKCDQCDFVTKEKRRLKHHIQFVHNKAQLPDLPCSRCEKTFKREYNLITHEKLHDDMEYPCEHCPKTFATSQYLSRHVAVHHSGRPTPSHPCDYCDATRASTQSLKSHLWFKHNIGGQMYTCYCGASFKAKHSLVSHQSSYHNVGPYECDFCAQNVAHTSEYYDVKAETTFDICTPCKRKLTCSSKEHEMVLMLESNDKIGPYIVLKDEIISHDKCATRRRPDCLISYPGKEHVIIECDENGHHDYDVACESGRIDEIIDELQDGRITLIRWNPDTYRVNGKTIRNTRQEKLDALENLIVTLIEKKHGEDDPHISVHYMFYSDNSPVIAKRWPVTMHY